MAKRYMSIWFPYLTTDWLTVKQPVLHGLPIIFTAKDHGRLMITAANPESEKQGIFPGSTAADAKATVANLQIFDDIPGKAVQLLTAIGEWSIRFTPFVAIDAPNGLILDISGCSHLWSGEEPYFANILNKLRSRGYVTYGAIADTIGTAWAIARFGKGSRIIEPSGHAAALMPLPPSALRLESEILERLRKVGFRTIGSFIGIKRSALRRRFGEQLLQRMDQALGTTYERIIPLQPQAPFEVRLPCLEPIRNAAGIEIALQKLLSMLCKRLQHEGKGLRTAILKCYRVDHRTIQVAINTSKASRNITHLFKLFELKIVQIEPDLGIELFVLEATQVEDLIAAQEAIWSAEYHSIESPEVAQLADRITGKFSNAVVCRYLPQEHYWPERSLKAYSSLTEKPATNWHKRPRPTQLLAKPEPIKVTVQVPDYPPMLFIYKNELHNIKKADGPERIEREWWLEDGEIRDYYIVEDEYGQRYWVFRSGHYTSDREALWYLHGYFA